MRQGQKCIGGRERSSWRRSNQSDKKRRKERILARFFLAT
jgi:hypothetical protein